MKRFAMILLGCALIMGMSQCKKDNTTNNESVRITLTADGGQNSKTVFDGTNFIWTNEQTEYIYVGCSGLEGCIGELTGTGDGTSRITFTGKLTETPPAESTLYFFYLGNGRHENASLVSFETQTGVFSDLTNHHIAIGNAEYKGEGAYTAKLDMAMAIAWFNTSASAFTGSSITLSGDGICNTATINYREGTITASRGDINISNGVSKNCYVALLPYSTGGPHTLTFTDGSSHSGSITFNSGIAAGDYYVSNPGLGASGLVVNPNNP